MESVDTQVRDAIRLIEDDNALCDVLTITTLDQDAVIRKARGRLARHRKTYGNRQLVGLDQESVQLVIAAARIIANAKEYIRPTGQDT